MCLTVFRVGHEVDSALNASGLLPILQIQWDILDLQKYPKIVFQVSRFRKRVLDDSLAIPGVPNFIAFEGVPLVFAKFGVSSRETSADWCAAEKHVKDWLLKEQPPTHFRNLWLAQRSSHMKPQGASSLLFPLKTAPRTPGPARPAARRKKQVTMAWCRVLQTRKQFLDFSSTKLTNSS